MSILKFYILGGHLAFYATGKDITNQFPYITVRFRIQKTALQIFISTASSYLSPFCKFRSTSTTMSPRLGYWDWYMSCRLEWISSLIISSCMYLLCIIYFDGQGFFAALHGNISKALLLSSVFVMSYSVKILSSPWFGSPLIQLLPM